MTVEQFPVNQHELMAFDHPDSYWQRGSWALECRLEQTLGCKWHVRPVRHGDQLPGALHCTAICPTSDLQALQGYLQGHGLHASVGSCGPANSLTVQIQSLSQFEGLIDEFKKDRANYPTILDKLHAASGREITPVAAAR